MKRGEKKKNGPRHAAMSERAEKMAKSHPTVGANGQEVNKSVIWTGVTRGGERVNNTEATGEIVGALLFFFFFFFLLPH